MGGISIWQILIILLVIVLVFGIGKLPAIGRDLGKALKEFRTSVGNDGGDAGGKKKGGKKSQTRGSKTTKRK